MPRNPRFAYNRADRVERLAQEVLGEALMDLRDPRIGFVTVTSVKMSPDLRLAKVFVSALGTDEERAASLAAIRHAAPHLRATLGQQVRMKYLPVLEVLEDTTAAYGERIETLLRQAGAATTPEDAAGPPPETDTDTETESAP